MLRILRFKYWIGGFSLVALLISCVAYEEHRAADKYKTHRTEYCSAFSTTTQQKESCLEERAESQDYVPWEIGIVSWPAGVTAWAIILTLFVIGWQSNETRRSAAATERSVAIANRQIEMMKDKERARVEVSANSFILRNNSPTFWYIVGDLKVRNLGMSRAYIKTFQAEMVWHDNASGEPTPDFPQQGNIFHDSYIDPTENCNKATPPSVHYFDTDSLNLDWFASAVYEGRVGVILRGFIEYGTVGTAYRRYFSFKWRGSGRADSYARLLGGPIPTDNEGRISNGHWSTELDEEHEMDKPQTDF